MTKNLASYLYADEAQCVQELLDSLSWSTGRQNRVHKTATDLVEQVRNGRRKMGELESFLQEYGLNSDEGRALMTLAEALLRIPDAETVSALIADKISAADWLSNQGNTKDLLVKAAGFGLSLTRKTLDSAMARVGEPVIRKAIIHAIRTLGKQFVLGRTIEEAVKNARSYEKRGYRMSYDMLGEGARTMADADKYFENYRYALSFIDGTKSADKPPGMSVKLSALHPRYDFRHEELCVPVLIEKLTTLCKIAAEKNVALTIDAEEVDRLEISIKIIEAVARNPALQAWQGLGMAVQSYQKRAPVLLDMLAKIAKETGRKLRVRLVKGAYWDTEIKRAQVLGLEHYPVFTRKANTDLSFLACAEKLMNQRDLFYPMLATHNAHTIAAVLDLAGNDRAGFEFQRLHGMGETLHDHVLSESQAAASVYAPCGSHEELLPYLVRRLLENGASTSFVHKIMDERVPVEEIVTDPVIDAQSHETKTHPMIPLPIDIFGDERANSVGSDLTEETTLSPILNQVQKTANDQGREAAPLIAGKAIKNGASLSILNPAHTQTTVGIAWNTSMTQVDEAFKVAKSGYKAWNKTPASERATVLETLADLMEEHSTSLMALCVHEAGKTVDDALAEIREAVDFCRYYAAQGRKEFTEEGTKLPGPTGESNVLTLHGRGVFICISPWNFPLAIFTGQVVAALMAGNAVIAKPAEQTPLIAMRMAELAFQAGLPAEALTILPGDGTIGAKIIEHPDVAGVAFTGSSEVARIINRALAAKDGAIVPLIAETGGQNAMIVDSSALPEQIVDDVLICAFGSAGQRCSALRVLYVQDDVADRIIPMLRGAMKERIVDNPALKHTDIGPVIDQDALDRLKAHREKLENIGQFIGEIPLTGSLAETGYFFAPVAYEINSIQQLDGEVFGPILHVIRYQKNDLQKIINEINATGYGLTFGVHSRIDKTIQTITDNIDVGNAYVNRTTIGAVVGVQPFGGHGISGTGPKAGGPHYMHRFSKEKVISIDTTRQGGNASLVSMSE